MSDFFSKGVNDAEKDLANDLLIYKVEYLGGYSFRKIFMKNQKEIIMESIPLGFYSTSIVGNAKFENKTLKEYINGRNFISEPLVVKKIGTDSLKLLIEKAKENLPAEVVGLTVNQ